jgi:hypothetical protein
LAAKLIWFVFGLTAIQRWFEGVGRSHCPTVIGISGKRGMQKSCTQQWLNGA